MGDPIEAHALAEALCEDRSEEAPLLIGSVKTNLGHLETAAGVAGLVKAMLVLKHGRIPASLHFETPNPNIDFVALKLRVPTALEPFPSDGWRAHGGRQFVWFWGRQRPCPSHGGAVAPAAGAFRRPPQPRVAVGAFCPIRGSSALFGIAPERLAG